MESWHANCASHGRVFFTPHHHQVTVVFDTVSVFGSFLSIFTNLHYSHDPSDIATAPVEAASISHLFSRHSPTMMPIGFRLQETIHSPSWKKFNSRDFSSMRFLKNVSAFGHLPEPSVIGLSHVLFWLDEHMRSLFSTKQK